ncbi:MAG: CvpA family protein [Lachnospiraceae bacterium]|nr:CvpA family protein [Lachnospiraceae bacterium]
MTAEYILIAMFIVMMYFLINGVRQGFLRVIFTLISSALALFIVAYMTPTIAEFIKEHTGIYALVYENVIEAISKLSMGQISETEAINSFNIPQVIKMLLISNNTSETYTTLLIDAFQDYIAAFMARMVVRIIALLIIFIFTKFLLRSIGIMLDFIDKIPVLHGLNRLAGGAVGLIEGTLIIWLFMLFMTIFVGGELGNTFFEIVESDKILSLIYNSNLLLKFVA